MTCDDYRSWISLASDGRLDDSRRAGLDLHLASCAGCRAFEERLDRGRSLLGNLPPTPHEDFTRSVLAAASRRPTWRLKAAVAAAILAVAAGAFLMNRPAPRGDDARRARLWMLLAQAARDPDLDLRREIEDARLPRGGDPDEDHWIDLVERAAAGDRRVLAGIEASGVLDRWRPGLLSPSPQPAESPEPFRRGRRLLYAGRPAEAAAAFRACLDLPDEKERWDDALFWIAFAESRSSRRPEALGAYVSLSQLESPWFDAAARREAQRLAMEDGLARPVGPYPLTLWSSTSERAGWALVEGFSPGSIWCTLELAGGNKGGPKAPVSLVIGGRVLQAATAEEFAAKYPGDVELLKERFPEILSFIREGVLELQIEDPNPPHGP